MIDIISLGDSWPACAGSRPFDVSLRCLSCKAGSIQWCLMYFSYNRSELRQRIYVLFSGSELVSIDSPLTLRRRLSVY